MPEHRKFVFELPDGGRRKSPGIACERLVKVRGERGETDRAHEGGASFQGVQSVDSFVAGLVTQRVEITGRMREEVGVQPRDRITLRTERVAQLLEHGRIQCRRREVSNFMFDGHHNIFLVSAAGRNQGFPEIGDCSTEMHSICS